MTQDNPRMGDLNELVERLKAMCVDWNAQPMDDGELPRIEPHCRDLRQAADALTSLIAERDGLRELLECALDEHEQREGRIVDPFSPHWSVSARTTLSLDTKEPS